MNMTGYEIAKSLCESANESLPSSSFVVVEKDYKKRNIFWMAENEDSKKLTEEELRLDLDVALVNDNGNGCAFLTEDFFGHS